MLTCPLCDFDKYIKLQSDAKDIIIQNYSCSFGIDVDAFLYSDIINLLQCTRCHLQYFSPVTEGSGQFYESLSRQPWYYTQRKFEFDYATEKILEFKPESILEVGCGRGYFLEKFKDSFLVCGTEYNPTARQVLAAKGIQLDDGCQTYDFVVLFQVVEHVQHLRALLSDLVRRVNPSGHLLITTPNPASPYMKEVFQILDFPPHHLTRWPCQALYSIAELFNMKVVDYFQEPISFEHFRQLISTRLAKQGAQPDDKQLQQLQNALMPYLYNMANQSGHTHGILFQNKVNA